VDAARELLVASDRLRRAGGWAGRAGVSHWECCTGGWSDVIVDAAHGLPAVCRHTVPNVPTFRTRAHLRAFQHQSFSQVHT